MGILLFRESNNYRGWFLHYFSRPTKDASREIRKAEAMEEAIAEVPWALLASDGYKFAPK